MITTMAGLKTGAFSELKIEGTSGNLGSD